MPRLAEEMLDGQHQTKDMSAMPELPTRASCRKDWKRICAELSLSVPLTTQLDKGHEYSPWSAAFTLLVYRSACHLVGKVLKFCSLYCRLMANWKVCGYCFPTGSLSLWWSSWRGHQLQRQGQERMWRTISMRERLADLLDD